MNKICVHFIVRFEPFIVYAVEAVIDYVDKILLYDTGSSTAQFPDYTLEDCRMLANKYPDKIVFKEIMTPDETCWNGRTIGTIKNSTRGKTSKGVVRKMQINDTDPNEYKYFMVIDGDEIYYKETIKRIKEVVIQEDWGTIQNFRVPLIWHCELDKTFWVGHTGRIFITEKTGMYTGSPGEMHYSKDTNAVFSYGDKNLAVRDELKPFVHFETYLKSWRRDVDKNDIIDINGLLPEVMIDNPIYIERFEKELKKPREDFFIAKQNEIG